MIRFRYKDTALLDTSLLSTYAQKLTPEINNIQQSINQNYTTDYASINLPHDKKMLHTVQAVIQEKQQLNPQVLIVCGIGGSNLGTIAGHESLNGKLFNTKNILRVYFVDTVDADYVYDVYSIVEDVLKQGKNVLINVVTKSGKTTETIANFEIFLSLLKKYKPNDFNDYVVATTDKDSPLWTIAEGYKFTVLEIPKKVGGRYSVLSAVGLFPLGMLGIDISQLLAGAASFLPHGLNVDINKNPAALSALIKYAYYQKNMRTNVLFIFDVQSAMLGYWYRQLVSESLGKEFNRKGERVDAGINPMVSVGSVDLHSVAQLYLGGPHDKFTTFISIEKNKHQMYIPGLPVFERCVKNIQGRPLSSIMDAILQGVKKAYQEDERPFCELIIPQKNPYYIGQFLQMYMLEVMYLGYLLDVNPFDQPDVELYKKETREILAHE